jgi:15-cis-phytoene synthase
VDNLLDRSYAHCSALTRKQAGNFYYSFLTLSREKRAAMCAIYAWMRRVDDLADDAPNPSKARLDVESFRDHTVRILKARNSKPESASTRREDELLWPAFADTAKRHGIPVEYFEGISEGALMDQEVLRYRNFEDLYAYCYRVASLVGLVSLKVFGYDRPETLQHVEAMGIAFQLTNILRDVSEDAGRGRIYIPKSEMDQFGVSEDDILRGNWSPGMHSLFKNFADRAETFYEKAQPTLELVSPESRPTLRIMEEIYHGILHRIRALDYNVLHQRARVPTWKKLAIVLKHQIRG